MSSAEYRRKKLGRAAKMAAVLCMYVLTIVFIVSSLGAFIVFTTSATLAGSQVKYQAYQGHQETTGNNGLIVRKATHQVAGTLHLKVDRADHAAVRNTLANDIERHNGVITRGMGRHPFNFGIKAVVSQEYAQRLVERINQPSRYLTPDYVPWMAEAQQNTINPRLTGTPEVEVKIRVIPLPATHWPIAKPITILAVIATISFSLLITSLSVMYAATAVHKALRPKTAS